MISPLRPGLILMLVFGGLTDLWAGDARLALLNNPFSKPSILAGPAEKPVERQQPVEEPVELQLNATLVSDIAPMVIVEGELLGIGEEIDGFRLLAVHEGRAVFTRKGERHSFDLVGSGEDVE